MAFFLFAMVAFFIWRYFDRRKKQRRVRLTNYQKRLKIVVAELFTQSNEMDTISKYSGLDRDPKWTRSYQDALSKLLMANERLNDCPEFLNGGQLDTAQEYLLLIARASYQVHKQFVVIAPVENFEQVIVQESYQETTYRAHTEEKPESKASEAKSNETKSKETQKKDSPQKEIPQKETQEDEVDENEVDSGYVIRLDRKQIHKKNDKL